MEGQLGRSSNRHVALLLTTLLLSASSALGQSDSITPSPATFPDRLRVVNAAGDLVAEVSFADYVRGVLKVEIEGELNASALNLSNAQKIEALKAQALAVQTYYLRRANDPACGSTASSPPSFKTSESCQVFETGPWTQNTLTVVTSAEVSSKALTMNGLIMSPMFFSKTPSGFTTSAEDADGLYNTFIRKDISPEFFNDPSLPENRRHGLSQRGTGVLAGPGTAFGMGHQAILQHYYGPMCPAVTRVTIVQGSTTIYHHDWQDNNDFNPENIANPTPTRALLPGDALNQRSLTPMSANQAATIKISFNEEVISPGQELVEIVVGGRVLGQTSAQVRRRPCSRADHGAPCEPVEYPETWTFTMSPEFIQSLPEGNVQVEINASNRFATNVPLDSNPRTFGFRAYGGTLQACDPGPDTTVSFTTSFPLFSVDALPTTA